MTLTPTGRRVLVKPAQPPIQSKGGIVFAADWAQPTGEGTILAVGARVQDASLKPGVKVYFTWLDALEVEQNGETFKLLFEQQILGVEA